MIVIRVHCEIVEDFVDVVLPSARKLPFAPDLGFAFVRGFIHGRARHGWAFDEDDDSDPEYRAAWRFGFKHGKKQPQKEPHPYYDYGMYFLKAPKKVMKAWQDVEDEIEREQDREAEEAGLFGDDDDDFDFDAEWRAYEEEQESMSGHERFDADTRAARRARRQRKLDKFRKY